MSNSSNTTALIIPKQDGERGKEQQRSLFCFSSSYYRVVIKFYTLIKYLSIHTAKDRAIANNNRYLFYSCNLENTRYEEARLSLIGFSKGCAVLNQFIHEFHFAEQNSQSQPVMAKIIRKISSMYFLDGGHAGKNNTWITDQSLLQTLAKLGTCALRLS